MPTSRHFGFWFSAKEVEDHIALEWKPHDRERLIAFLSQVEPMAAAAVASICLLCGARLGSVAVVSDETWLWRNDLAHYVGNHGVRLLNEMCDHIRQRDYDPNVNFTTMDEGHGKLDQPPRLA